MAWKYVRDLLLAIIGFLVSGVLGFLGLAPEAVIARVWGAEIVVSFIKTMVSVSPDTLRWWFVILSDSALAFAVVFAMAIPLRKASIMADRLTKDFDALRVEIVSAKRLAETAIEESRKKELNAKRLHERTQNALQKWRKQKMEE